jgi:hypothetical protein
MDIDLTELCSPKTFLERYPDLANESSLRWSMRHRHQNGLAAAGAVLEVRQRADQVRPKLLINPPRFAAVLADQGKYLRRVGAA